jgi:hypothetical protein
VPNVYALAASPVGRAAIVLAQEEHKTKGFRAVFGVVLMFGILCGGVWLLLQSSFGPKQAYLISGTAFWGCWLVLSIIWLTGVPGFGLLGIPRSTPQYYGPQGSERRWVVADPDGPAKIKAKYTAFEERNSDAFFTIDDSDQNQADQQDKAAAESAAQELAPEVYAVDLGVGAADITIPGVVVVTATQLGKDGGEWRYARVTFGPATPNATDNEPTKALIARIKPKTFALYLDNGNLATPTYYAIGLFLLLFLAHTAALVKYELNRVPQPQGSPERATASL